MSTNIKTSKMPVLISEFLQINFGLIQYKSLLKEERRIFTNISWFWHWNDFVMWSKKKLIVF